MSLPKGYTTAVELVPGDVIALAAGDARQVFSTARAAQGRYVSVDWGDGRHSLLDLTTVLPLLYSSPTRTPLEEATDDGSTTDAAAGTD